jgi:hypothetical protein
MSCDFAVEGKARAVVAAPPTAPVVGPEQFDRIQAEPGVEIACGTCVWTESQSLKKIPDHTTPGKLCPVVFPEVHIVPAQQPIELLNREAVSSHPHGKKRHLPSAVFDRLLEEALGPGWVVTDVGRRFELQPVASEEVDEICQLQFAEARQPLRRNNQQLRRSLHDSATEGPPGRFLIREINAG